MQRDVPSCRHASSTMLFAGIVSAARSTNGESMLWSKLGPTCRVPRLLYMDEQQHSCSTAREPVELLPYRQTCSMLEARQGGRYGTCCGSLDFLPSRRMCSSGSPGLLKLRVQCRTTEVATMRGFDSKPLRVATSSPQALSLRKPSSMQSTPRAAVITP